MKPYIAAGADGFGLGSALFAPDRTLNDIEERAQLFAESWRSTTGGAARAG
jgi:2-dehydro-3-deoxyphosphogalactonate aldolase